VQQLMKEVYRVLKSGGYFMIISRNGSCTMDPYLYNDGLNWDVKIKEIESDRGKLHNINFIYTINSTK